MSSRCVRLQTWASLLLSWVVLGVWLAIGAQVMSELELQADRQRNQDYCTTLKEIRDTLTNADFQAWEQLLRAITGRGICRAPNCGGDFLGANATAGAGNSTNSTSSATAEAAAVRANWSVRGAGFFLLTAVTSIGYGTYVPTTAEGKAFAGAFVLVGLPLFGVANGLLAIRLRMFFARAAHRLSPRRAAPLELLLLGTALLV